MADYIVKSPQGQSFRITAPDGATQADVLAYAVQQFSNAPHAHEELKKLNPGEYDPTSKEYQAKYGATSGASDLSNFAAGAGKAVVDLGRGIKQLAVEGANKVGLASDQTAADTQAGIDEAKTLDASLMHSKAGIAGHIAGDFATTFVPAGVIARAAQAAKLARAAAAARGILAPTTIAGAAGTGAALGAIQPVASDESRLANTAAGAIAGAAGQVLPTALSRVAQPIKNALAPAAAKAAQVLRDAGVPLDVAQATGSTLATRVKAALGDNPFSAGTMDANKAAQGTAYNRAVLRTVGENADAATPEVLGAARDRIGGVMDDIADRSPIKYDGRLETRLAAFEKQAGDELTNEQIGVVRRQLQNIIDKAAAGDGSINGQAYQNIRQSLDRVSLGNDQALGEAARSIRAILDDGLQRSAAPGDAAALTQARTQYRRLMQIADSKPSDTGDVSPQKLFNVITAKKNQAQGTFGKGDQVLPELARAGKTILPDKVPNSGTPARILAQTMLPAVIGGAAGAGAGALGGKKEGVEAGLGGLALGAGVPMLLGRGMGAQGLQRYLANGLGSGAIREALMAPNANPTVRMILQRSLLPAGQLAPE